MAIQSNEPATATYMHACSCNLCGDSGIKNILPLEEYSIVECLNCGLARLNPFPSTEALDQIYGDSYYTATPPVAPRNMAGIVRTLVLEAFWQYPRKGNLLTQLIARLVLWPLRNRAMPVPFPEKVPVLDVGCGNGMRLIELKAYGHKALFGVEPSAEAAQFATANDGLNIHIGTLEDAKYPDEYFGLIIMNQVLEHVTDPLSTLREVRRIIRPDGMFYLTVPNFGSIEAKLFGKNWYAICLPTHLYHFTNATLSALISKAGFEISKCRTDSLPLVLEKSLDQWTKDRKDWFAPLLSNSLSKVIFRFLILIADTFRKGDMLRVVAIPSSNICKHNGLSISESQNPY